MNTKKFRPPGDVVGSAALCDPSSPQQLSSSLHQEELENSATSSQQHCAGCRLHEDYTPWSALAQSCLGTDNAAFDCAESLFDYPLGMLLMPIARTHYQYQSSENDRCRPRPQRDAMETTPAQLHKQPLPPPPQQQQERDHGLFSFSNASTTWSRGGEPKTCSFSPLVAAPDTILPAMENQKVPLPGNCMDAPVTPVGDGAARAPAAESSTAPRKTRIRWTQDLHERFVECVNQLGGADRTTPRAIQKLMNSDGITIFHIKSHLQKYRMAKYMLASSSEAKQVEKRAAGDDMQELNLKSGMHITEALRVQHVMQRRLGKQLKMQRDLQLRIEAQGKVLQKMVEDHLKESRNATEPQEVDDGSPVSGQDDNAFDNLHLPFGDGSNSSDEDVFTSFTP
nr:uncharacterized protein LOC109739088 [Aegilops tauschii subsp. strangulata]